MMKSDPKWTEWIERVSETEAVGGLVAGRLRVVWDGIIAQQIDRELGVPVQLLGTTYLQDHLADLNHAIGFPRH
jgi:hypothetical protein